MGVPAPSLLGELHLCNTEQWKTQYGPPMIMVRVRMPMFCLYLLHKMVTTDHTVGVVYNLHKNVCVSFLSFRKQQNLYVNSNKYSSTKFSIILCYGCVSWCTTLWGRKHHWLYTSLIEQLLLHVSKVWLYLWINK